MKIFAYVLLKLAESNGKATMTLSDVTFRDNSELMNKATVASLNFIDLRVNSGPAVNETEFNRWLLEAEPSALIVTPMPTERLRHGRVVTFGPYSLRFVMRSLWVQQRLIAQTLARELAPGALLYYRHSRLATAVLMLKRLRPDVKLAVVRMHPSHSDTLAAKPGLKRVKAWIIETINSRITRRIGKSAEWVDCVTTRQADLLYSELGRKVHVVMNGVNTAAFLPLSPERRDEIRRCFNIPDNSIVVGYCGGSPMQRGAAEIAALVQRNPKIVGVVIGNTTSAERAILSHARMRVLGELAYEDIPELVGMFDIAVAFDAPGRSDIVGNSNQKVRQALACGAWVMTQASDLPLEQHPFLGRNVAARDAESLSQYVTDAAPFLDQRQERATYARAHLDTGSIFAKRHISCIDKK